MLSTRCLRLRIDRRYALAEFVRNFPFEPVDVICCDYMSEGTMAPAALRKANAAKSSDSASKPAHLFDPFGSAFETTFLEALEPALEDLAKHGVRVILMRVSEPLKIRHRRYTC